MKFQYSLSLRNIHKNKRTQSERPSCKYRHWICTSYSFILSCHRSPRALVFAMTSALNVDLEKRFLQVASVCRNSALIEDLESLLVDWERVKNLHYNLTLLRGILQSDSKNSSVKFLYLRSESCLQFSHFVNTSRSAFSIITDSSCSRTCSRRDSMCP